ncbi:hypothetical protein STENM223S_01562 [Streptomyces tendae]
MSACCSPFHLTSFSSTTERAGMLMPRARVSAAVVPAQGAGEVVAGADGDQAERGAGAHDGLQRQVRQAVTADGDQGARALGDGGTRACQGVLGVRAEHRPTQRIRRPATRKRPAVPPGRPGRDPRWG